jgi:DNA-directed RNA polymerase specialized sigma24 family protein
MSAAFIQRIHAQSQAKSRFVRRRPEILVFRSQPDPTDVTDDLDPVLSLYRPRTLAMLNRYLHLASAVGRLPSLIAREAFRARVSSYRLHTFEDAVIFVLDMERSLARLNAVDRDLIARLVLQGHSHDAVARLLHCSRKSITRRLCVALDRLSANLLAHGLLKELR